jgi:hypothetical protein
MLVYPPPCHSPVQLQQGGVDVPGNPHTILNFEGGVSVVDNGGGKATITINASGSSPMRTDRAAVATVNPRVWLVEAKAQSEPFAFYHNGRRLRRGLDYTLTESSAGTGYDTLTLKLMTPAVNSIFSTDYVPF